VPQPMERHIVRYPVGVGAGAVPFAAPPVVLIQDCAGRGGEQQPRRSGRVLREVQKEFGGDQGGEWQGAYPGLGLGWGEEVDNVACQSSGTLVGLDATSGKQLGSLPDPAAQRIMPSLGAAYHGLLYTHGENTGVILDARTGADVVDNVAVSPDIVIPGYGIESGDNTLTVYPAIG